MTSLPTILIKATAVNNLTTARYFAAIGAEWIGFNFDAKYARAIDTQIAFELMTWLSGPRFVGEMGDLPLETINTLADELQLGVIQTNIYLEKNALSPTVEAVIRRIPLDLLSLQAEDLHQIVESESGIAQFFIDAGHLHWEQVKHAAPEIARALVEICAKYPVILGIKPLYEDIAVALKNLPIIGISVESGEELSTGMQDFEAIDILLEKLDSH
ncbi:MAG: hypothetical protein R2798_00080 [Chitinophagales bacterium]|nr:hypothetical protein [Bacteroidota bacterium]MCB9043797.1 hypothetical protein [Chitinophagales bacterium]